ncbi:DMT family transporter [Candidatus Roizmanbacteria bacterium]|nr:DMT family transporter [Candidatus Roizmanbacteria bacterium]
MQYLLIILSALFLGIANIFYKKSSVLIGAINTTFFYYLFGFILAFIIWIFFKEKTEFTPGNMGNAFLISFFLVISVLLFTIGINKPEVSIPIASTIRSLAFVSTVFIAILFLKESLTVTNTIGIMLAIASVVVFSLKV